MATTGSQSGALDSTVSETPETSSTSSNDQVALAAFAAAWTGSLDDSETGMDADLGVEPDVLPTRSGAPRQRARTNASAPRLPGRGVIVVSATAGVGVVLADFGLTGGVSMFFGLWFVVICLIGAMAVRRQDLFTAGVLAPLLFGAIIAAISLVAPSTFAESGGFGKVFPTGLTAHAGALIAGYGVALITVAARASGRS